MRLGQFHGVDGEHGALQRRINGKKNKNKKDKKTVSSASSRVGSIGVCARLKISGKIEELTVTTSCDIPTKNYESVR